MVLADVDTDDTILIYLLTSYSCLSCAYVIDIIPMLIILIADFFDIIHHPYADVDDTIIILMLVDTIHTCIQLQLFIYLIILHDEGNCRRVREACTILDLPVEFRPCPGIVPYCSTVVLHYILFCTC